MTVHIDKLVGYDPGKQRWEQRTNVTGESYWHVTEEIGQLGGMSVSGHIEAFGRTREEALARLSEERKKLMDTFWGA